MTPKQERFVAEYLIDLNATQAAIRCGYSPKSAHVQGSRMLSDAKVAAAVAEKKEAQLKTAELTAVRLLEEYRRLTFQHAKQFVDATGTMIPIQDLSDEAAACVSDFEMVRKNVEAGDGHTDTVLKMRRWSKVEAMRDMAKHFGVLSESIKHLGEVTFRWAE